MKQKSKKHEDKYLTEYDYEFRKTGYRGYFDYEADTTGKWVLFAATLLVIIAIILFFIFV